MTTNEAKARRRAKIRERKKAEQDAVLEAYIAWVADTAPPLTNEQRDKLAILLRGSA